MLLGVFLAFGTLRAGAAGLTAAQRTAISEMLSRVLDREVSGNTTRILQVSESSGQLTLYASVGMSYYPFREANVAAIYDSIRALLPESYRRKRIVLITDRHAIEQLIPRPFRSREGSGVRFTNRSSAPLVQCVSSPNRPTDGLAGRHIALWQSHGRYFDQAENRWKWQRSRLWSTCEDLYTQSYVLPYLVPMLERAGANVLLPRERDVQRHEAIADNDSGVDVGSRYDEYTGDRRWYADGPGFAHRAEVYEACRNPFSEGTARAVKTVADGDRESRAVWSVTRPEAGEYAVYVSYRSERNSAEDARYTVHHAGGDTEFRVNQTMGGGTWIYLGTFPFAASEGPVVTLTNRSGRRGRVVTADAVRLGGGMGNVARVPAPEFRTEDLDYVPQTSGLPRFCEGARYWLQWAGFSEEVYCGKEGLDDYKEDYMSRAHWVNALMGGSERLPDEEGLGIPVDMALAFHSDAGTRRTEETIGTLGIFYTAENGGKFHGGADRYLSRDLTDMVMSEIVRDVRCTYEPEWRRRGLWNRSYYEARVPHVPTMLLELLSHQNFADMCYGLDPRFRFLVSRAVYKGILRFLSYQYDRPCVVQPLPVEGFGALFTENEGEVRLRWRGVVDSLEPSAVPTGYILYTRRDGGGFDNGRYVADEECTVQQDPGVIYDYRVAAVNSGGESFPSETLSAAWVPQPKGRVLVVNGFDRVSGPPCVSTDSLAGFRYDLDRGVPYLRDISFIGEQRIYDRALTESENDQEALGSCYSDYETEVIAGNTFDYARLHGASLLRAGYSFCSSSAQAVTEGAVDPLDYFFLDLILGKQRRTTMGRGTSGEAFAAFPPALQAAVRRFAESGRSLLVSGCYVASDLLRNPAATEDDQTFARDVLHCGYRGMQASRRGEVQTVASPARLAPARYRFNTQPCGERYSVESVDALTPAEGAFTAMRYPNDQTAAVGYAGEFRAWVMSFPFEALDDDAQRDELMAGIMRFLEPRK